MRYIGCKTKLLTNIEQSIQENCPNVKSVCDIFSGTASVARHLKKNYEITSNDLLYFSYVLQVATIENPSVPDFKKLHGAGISNPISYFNDMPIETMESLEKEKRLFQNTFSPVGERMYFTEENALRIDYARNTLEDWRNNNLLTRFEYFYLLACIIEGIPFVSNIAGTYGAFNKFWDKRAFKTYQLIDLPVNNNGLSNNSFNEDGVELLKKIKGDLLYIDPPYNGRQYLPNYHVLETAAIYDATDFRGVTGQRPDEGKKSDFCQKRKVLPAFEELISNANFEHIILSYNTEGLMSIDQIQDDMCRHCMPSSFKITKIPYRRFKSRSTTHDGDISELLIYAKKEL